MIFFLVFSRSRVLFFFSFVFFFLLILSGRYLLSFATRIDGDCGGCVVRHPSYTLSQVALKSALWFGGELANHSVFDATKRINNSRLGNID